MLCSFVFDPSLPWHLGTRIAWLKPGRQDDAGARRRLEGLVDLLNNGIIILSKRMYGRAGVLF